MSLNPLQPPSMPPKPPKIQKAQRLLDFIAVLTTRHYPLTRSQLFDEVPGYQLPRDHGATEESVRRTFERDKKELLELGFPLRTIEDPRAEPEDRQRYQLSHRDFYLPYLKLVRRQDGEPLEGRRKASVTPSAGIQPEQAWVVADALQRLRKSPGLPRSVAADSAFRKLTFDLVDAESDFPSHEVILSSDDDEVGKRMDLLAAALRKRRVVSFEYRSAARDEVSQRRVEPTALLFKLNRWYLVAHDLDREASRTFRVSRMRAVQPQGPHMAFEVSGVDLDAWTRAEAWNLPGDEAPLAEVDVRFHFPRSLWAERNSHGEVVSTHHDGSAVRRFQVRSVDAFLRWLLAQGTEVSIEAPDELNEALWALRLQVAALYGATEGGS